ncbi:MAG: NUDIX hydrolase [Parvularculaceae bacterium]
MTNRPDHAPAFEQRTPPGEDRERAVCVRCGFIDYRNPRIVVGAVADWQGRILLCRRAIEPRIGFWTLPAGYLELGESAEEGALREAREEAGADLEIDRVLAVYSVPRIGQVQIIFRARLNAASLAPGAESLEAALFEWADIPWSDIAFPTVNWALQHHRQSMAKADFAPFSNPVEGL